MENNHEDIKTLEETLENSVKLREEITKEKLFIADKIGFKNFAESLLKTDQHGVIIDEEKYSRI